MEESNLSASAIETVKTALQKQGVAVIDRSSITPDQRALIAGQKFDQALLNALGVDAVLNVSIEGEGRSASSGTAVVLQLVGADGLIYGTGRAQQKGRGLVAGFSSPRLRLEELSRDALAAALSGVEIVKQH